MEQKNSIDRSLFTKYKKEKYLKSTVDTIKGIKTILQLFDDLDDSDFLRIINSQTKKLIGEVEKLKQIHENSEKIVEIVLKFIENIFKNFDVKLFYNLTPNISYEEYAKKDIGEQIINNIFDGKMSNKNPNFIEKEYVKGGNCHHWSILIKKIFDTLNIEGLHCEIRRFQKGHSFIVLQHKNKIRILDIIEDGKALGLKEVNASGSAKGNEIITKVMDSDNSSIMDFSNIEKFAEHTDNENTKGIRLQIDRIKAEVVGDILRIEITKDKSKKIKTYEIKLNKTTKTYNKKDFIKKILPWVQKALIIVGKKLPQGYIPENM